MKERKLIAVLLVMAMLVCTLAGCGGKSSKNDQLTVAVNAEMVTTIPWNHNDAWTYFVLDEVYETLIKMDQDGNLQPGLATSWEMIDDTHYRFHLRENVKFHNGNAFTAEDVLYSLSLSNEAPSTQGTLTPLVIDECKIEDDHTIVIATDGAYPNYFNTCAISIGAIVDKETFEKDPEAKTPVGTGPFKWVEWKTGDYVMLEANKDWWGGAIAFNKLMIRTITDNNTRAMEVQSGGVDVAVVDVNDVETIKAAKNVSLKSTKLAQTAFLTWNTTKAPFDDVKFRKAIKQAIDIDTLVDTLWFGLGEVSYSPVPSMSTGYAKPEEKYPFDVEAAKKLVEESNYDGRPLTMVARPSGGYDRAATMLQNYFAEVGINTEIKILDSANFSAALTNGEFDIAVTGWTLNTNDAAETFTMFGTKTAGQPGTGNRNYYSNAELDAYIEAATHAMDPAERLDQYTKAQQLLIDEVVGVDLYLATQFVAYNSKLNDDFQCICNKMIRYETVTFK